MSNPKQFIGINVETLLLVAIWETPFIFQGCFKISDLQTDDTSLFFFRCKAYHMQPIDILTHDFLPDQYELTHLYNEAGLIQLNNLNQEQEDALYLLKYALNITLGKMLTNRKTHFTSIDNIAMQALINKVRPILNKELALPEEDHIGFAVAMDFCPTEDIAQLAALTLLGKLKNVDHKMIKTH
jgi:hypothetical protein